jgi:hypothetical protein
MIVILASRNSHRSTDVRLLHLMSGCAKRVQQLRASVSSSLPDENGGWEANGLSEHGCMHGRVRDRVSAKAYFDLNYQPCKLKLASIILSIKATSLCDSLHISQIQTKEKP